LHMPLSPSRCAASGLPRALRILYKRAPISRLLDSPGHPRQQLALTACYTLALVIMELPLHIPRLLPLRHDDGGVVVRRALLALCAREHREKREADRLDVELRVPVVVEDVEACAVVGRGHVESTGAARVSAAAARNEHAASIRAGKKSAAGGGGSWRRLAAAARGGGTRRRWWYAQILPSE
jgi:hypothetical protein